MRVHNRAYIIDGGLGSGFVIGNDGRQNLVATALHNLVDQADAPLGRLQLATMMVSSEAGRRFHIAGVHRFPEHDLAILRLSKSRTKLSPLALNSDVPESGSDLLGLGYELSGRPSIWIGSEIKHFSLRAAPGTFESEIQTWHSQIPNAEMFCAPGSSEYRLAADTIKGSSGGPWLDRSGKVVAMSHTADGGRGLGFSNAIPAREIEAAMLEL